MAKKASFGQIMGDVGMATAQTLGVGELAALATGKSLDDLMNYQYKTKFGKGFDKGADVASKIFGATAPIAGAVGASALGLPPTVGASAASMGQNLLNTKLEKSGIGVPKPPKPEVSTSPTPDYMKDTNLTSSIPAYTPYKKGGVVNGIVINIEKDELEVNPKTGEIVNDFKDKPKHPKGKDIINQKGNVVAKEGNVIIPAKYREEYIKGNTEKRMEIIDEVMEDFMDREEEEMENNNEEVENEENYNEEENGEEVEKAKKGTIVGPSLEETLSKRKMTNYPALNTTNPNATLLTTFPSVPTSINAPSSITSGRKLGEISGLSYQFGGKSYGTPYAGTTATDAAGTTAGTTATEPSDLNQVALMYGLSGASQMPFYAKNKKEAEAALKKLGEQPLPKYDITPEMLQARQRAAQDYATLQGMARSGYTPQEKAAIQQQMAQSQRTALLQAQNVGAPQAVVGTAFNQQRINSLLAAAAQDAALRRQNIAAAQAAGRYLDQTGADISAQRTRQMGLDVQRRALQEQTLGAALSQAKVGQANAQSQMMGGAGLALSNFL